MKNKTRVFFVAAAILSVIGIGLSLYLFAVKFVPLGSDIYGHLFKADLLYEKISQGDYFPKYTEFWYNGIQPFRYWAPLPYYFLALLKLMASGDIIVAYYIFAGMSFFVGGMGFLLIGANRGHIVRGTLMGVMWFFMPDNIRVFFSEGNFPRMFIAMLLPYFFLFVLKFLEREKTKIDISSLIFIFVILLVFSLSHLMIAAMTAVSVFVLCGIDAAVKKSMRSWIILTVVMLLSFVSGGVFIVPALRGGVVGMNSSATGEVMQSLSMPAVQSLNPILRFMSNGGRDAFYFGIALLILCVVGTLFSGKNSRAWFLTAVLIFLGTTPTFSFFLEKLPMSELFWMRRFAPIATAFGMIGLLEWHSAKRKVIWGFIILLLADLIPSFMFIAPNQEKNDIPLLEEAATMTQQRMAIIDLSLWGSEASYYICTPPQKKLYSYGWAWQGAETAPNIMLLNTAFEHKSYNYIFDRALELGNDTVLVKKDFVTQAQSVAPITFCAEASGYNLVCEEKSAMLFHRETPETFGTKTEYENLAIGDGASVTPIIYPSFFHGESESLDDYSFDELVKYKTIFLSGFTYKNQKKAEDLLSDLAQNGVNIVVDTDSLKTVGGRTKFLDFTVNKVDFYSEYPDLYLGTKKLSNKSLPIKDWSTSYISGADEAEFLPIVTASYAQEKLTAVAKRGNICMVSMGLFYNAFTQNDLELLGIFDSIFAVTRQDLPDRTLVPIDVSYTNDKILITSPEPDVNTAIAAQDIFRGDNDCYSADNLLFVNDGETCVKITSVYSPLLWALSIFGVCAMVAFCGIRKYFVTFNKTIDKDKKL